MPSKSPINIQIMKFKYLSILTLFVSFSLFLACEEAEVLPVEAYSCSLGVEDNSANHPKAEVYQAILDKHQRRGLVGVSMMVKDDDGIWLGGSGYADLASNVRVEACQPFLIASISKTFTAATVFALIDDGILTLEDSVGKWLSTEIVEKIDNANESTIAHLLAHTSGIRDYYTISLELDRLNNRYNNWRQEDILAFVYGKKADHPVGETYTYSNTNYLLLGMIIEAASGKSLSAMYNEKIFEPLNLQSAYYGTAKPIPDGAVKGYVDFYGNGQYAESEFLYKDELSTADGGIAINAYDLGIFFERLMKGQLLSQSSFNNMTNWFDLPSDWVDEDIGHFQNGYGLERNQTPYEISVGHTGGIDGFLTIAQYFPETDKTFVLLANTASYDGGPRLSIYQETLAAMFE